jgi:hypothetical protein
MTSVAIQQLRDALSNPVGLYGAGRMMSDPNCEDCHGRGVFVCPWCKRKGCDQCGYTGWITCTCD